MPQPTPSSAVLRMLPYLVAVAFFMESLDTTILNTALPAMASALHVAPLSMKSVLTSYTLSLAVFIPVSGWVADRFGNARGVRVCDWLVHPWARCCAASRATCTYWWRFASCRAWAAR